MTVCSMTGYGIETRESESGTVTVEIKSVNSRFLDLQFRISDDLRAVEPALREAITQRIIRGKVECRVSFGRKIGEDSLPRLNPGVLSGLTELQQIVRTALPDAAQLTVGEVLRWPGMLEESKFSDDALQSDIVTALQGALKAFVDCRAREGAALTAALEMRINAMDDIVKRITPLIPQLTAQFQQKAILRLQEALGLVTENGVITRDDAMERIRQEVTIYGIRIDIAEEISRLAAHLAETREILAKGGQIGKRLDFMMQELNREANTIGSKAAIKELADASMALKLLIDQMREQVQNLE